MQSELADARRAGQTPLAVGTHDEKIGPTQLVAHHHVGIILDHIDGYLGRRGLRCCDDVFDCRTDHGLEPLVILINAALCSLALT